MQIALCNFGERVGSPVSLKSEPEHHTLSDLRVSNFAQMWTGWRETPDAEQGWVTDSKKVSEISMSLGFLGQDWKLDGLALAFLCLVILKTK